MKKTFVLSFSIIALFLTGTSLSAQSTCCSKTKSDSACAPEKEQRAGCSPSSCRGEQTKFGEVKVITSLRKNLISLKAEMEKYTVTKFSQRSYSVHGLVGESDDESLNIIVTEVKLIEKELKNKLGKSLTAFSLPKGKAKQVKYLSKRIKGLKAFLAK